MEVSISDFNQDELIQSWQRHANALLNGVDWKPPISQFRKYADGASLYIAAPVDALYSATEVNEEAWNRAVSDLNGNVCEPLSTAVSRLKEIVSKEVNPKILEVKKGAEEHSVQFLVDDDFVSVGMGNGSLTFPVNEIPPLDEINWNKVDDIPVILVTGTNGKTTTVRLLESIFGEAGYFTGTTSTDGVRINGETVKEGDYSGSEGAREILRTREVNTAILEVARGGILRRGVVDVNASAAVITNVADDHLGDYGINSVEEMALTKFVVRKTLSDDAPLVLNADDELLKKEAENYDGRIIWFGSPEENPAIDELHKTGELSYAINGNFVFYSGGNVEVIAKVTEVPVTLNGAAKHNVANCLGAIALAKGMGIKTEAIQKGLNNFGSSYENNPCRANLIESNGLKIMLDFAHNPHGLRAIVEMVKQIPAKRRLILLGQAGDRRNDDVEKLVLVASQLNPDKVIAAEIPKYLRGREPEEVPNLIKKYFVENGTAEENISIVSEMAKGVENALKWARKGDFLLLLVLDQRFEIYELIQEFIKRCDFIDEK